MIFYDIFINNGVEAFGTDSKTITVNENTRRVDEKALAREVSHENPLVTEPVAEAVIHSEAKAWVNFLAQGNVIQIKAGNDVIMRLYADVKVKGGSINLARARELMPEEVHTEQDMVDHAAELVARAGLEIRAHAEVEQKFTDLVRAAYGGTERIAILERPRLMRKDSTGTETPGGTTPGGGGGDTGGGGGDDGPDGIE
jgi:uncharacterized membrane protein YgcG